MPHAKIYTLNHPITNVPFYVGSTNGALNLRLNIHMWCAKNRPVGSVLRYINELGSRPTISELDAISDAENVEVRKLETYWCEQLRAWGFALLNDNAPYRVYTVAHDRITTEELNFLRSNRKYHAVCRLMKGSRVSPQTIQKVIDKNGSCLKRTVSKVRAFIEILRSLDTENYVFKNRVQMRILSSSELDNLKKCEGMPDNGFNRKAGFSKGSLTRAKKTGLLRFDKYYTAKQLLQL